MTRLPGKARRTRSPRSSSKPGELVGYYIAPSHDFTQYTRDYEEKYWSKDTAFDWQQSVPANLKEHLESSPPDEYQRIASLALPLVDQALGYRIEEIRLAGLPMDDDGLKAIGESLPFDRKSVEQALSIQEPLKRLALPITQLTDKLAILKLDCMELREQRRLKLFKVGTVVRQLETDAESREQASRLSSLANELDGVRRTLKKAREQVRIERAELETLIRRKLDAIEPQVLADLEATRELVRCSIGSAALPKDSETLSRLRDLVLKRQLRGLKDIANHALVVEQSAIAPLTQGIIHYKRHREIQEAMTTFVNDEAKHSAVFRRFMADNLEAKERVSQSIVKGADRYLLLARIMPSGAIFLAVIVEAIGGAFLEFFGHERNMPDPLFRSICKTIAERDERRHQDICAETYNELYRKGGRWERFRNNVALKVTMRAAYGNKNEDHHLMQACRAFGAATPYQFIADSLSQQLARIGMYVSPERLLTFMPGASQLGPTEDLAVGAAAEFVDSEFGYEILR